MELDGLSVEQRRQLSRVLRRGAVPSDPAVLTAAVRLHDLGEHYRLARRRRRTTGALPLTSEGLKGFRSRVSGCIAAGAGSKTSTSQRSSLKTALRRSIIHKRVSTVENHA